jgi:hypothetical protein
LDDSDDVDDEDGESKDDSVSRFDEGRGESDDESNDEDDDEEGPEGVGKRTNEGIGEFTAVGVAVESQGFEVSSKLSTVAICGQLAAVTGRRVKDGVGITGENSGVVSLSRSRDGSSGAGGKRRFRSSRSLAIASSSERMRIFR